MYAPRPPASPQLARGYPVPSVLRPPPSPLSTSAMPQASAHPRTPTAIDAWHYQPEHSWSPYTIYEGRARQYPHPTYHHAELPTLGHQPTARALPDDYAPRPPTSYIHHATYEVPMPKTLPFSPQPPFFNSPVPTIARTFPRPFGASALLYYPLDAERR
jgi:hypothetical protein